MNKILLIGPTMSSSERAIGGTTISFGILDNHLTQKNIPHRIVSINATSNRWLSALVCLAQALIYIPSYAVIMLNVNPRGAVFLAPFIRLYSKILSRKYVFRMFGGDLIEIYEKQSRLGKCLMQHSVLNADILYLQTRQFIKFFKPKSKIRYGCPHREFLKILKKITPSINDFFCWSSNENQRHRSCY